MIYGLCDRTRVEATPKGRADCPTCGGELRAKCGRIVTWHWAHVAKDCDPWSEGESAWHLGWKMLAPPDLREVAFGRHRADMVTPWGKIIELQHSSISVGEIEERERYYDNMAWVIDAAPFANNLHLKWGEGRAFLSFRWTHPRRTLLAIKRPMFFDLGGGDLLEIRKIYQDDRVSGWGSRTTQTDFMSRFFGHELVGLPGRGATGFDRWMKRNTHSDCSECDTFVNVSDMDRICDGPGEFRWLCRNCVLPCGACGATVRGHRTAYSLICGSGQAAKSRHVCYDCWWKHERRRMDALNRRRAA